jgi:hypothetical protein
MAYRQAFSPIYFLNSSKSEHKSAYNSMFVAECPESAEVVLNPPWIIQTHMFRAGHMPYMRLVKKLITN